MELIKAIFAIMMIVGMTWFVAMVVAGESNCKDGFIVNSSLKITCNFKH